MGQLGIAFLFLAGLIGSDCEICAGQPLAGLALAGLVVLVEFVILRAVWAMVRPGLRFDLPVVATVATAIAAIWIWWPW